MLHAVKACTCGQVLWAEGADKCVCCEAQGGVIWHCQDCGQLYYSAAPHDCTQETLTEAALRLRRVEG